MYPACPSKNLFCASVNSADVVSYSLRTREYFLYAVRQSFSAILSLSNLAERISSCSAALSVVSDFAFSAASLAGAFSISLSLRLSALIFCSHCFIFSSHLFFSLLSFPRVNFASSSSVTILLRASKISSSLFVRSMSTATFSISLRKFGKFFLSAESFLNFSSLSAMIFSYSFIFSLMSAIFSSLAFSSESLFIFLEFCFMDFSVFSVES